MHAICKALSGLRLQIHHAIFSYFSFCLIIKWHFIQPFVDWKHSNKVNRTIGILQFVHTMGLTLKKLCLIRCDLLWKSYTFDLTWLTLWKSYIFDLKWLTMEKLRLWFHETYYGKATSLISWDLLWKSYVFDFMRLTMEKLRLWFHETYRIAGYFCGYKFLRFDPRIDWINLCGFYFCDRRSKRKKFCGSKGKFNFDSIKYRVVWHLYSYKNYRHQMTYKRPPNMTCGGTKITWN